MHKNKKEHMAFYDVFIMEHFVEPFTPFFRETLGFTPNGITWLSNISSFIALIFLWNKNLLLFFVFWHINYWFDCMDGYMARKYDMVSDYGDMIDHLGDWISLLGIFIILVVKYKLIKKWKKNIGYIIFAGISAIMTFIHVGCTERIAEKRKFKKSKTLEPTKGACLDTKWLNFTKFWGIGNSNLYQSIMVLLVVGNA